VFQLAALVGHGGGRALRRTVVVAALSCLTAGAAWADWTATVETETRLGVWLADWLNRIRAQSAAEPYLPGLVWMLPEEAAAQAGMKARLLEHIAYREHSPAVTEAAAAGLRDMVHALPVTGRAVLERTDPRWLEANPAADPVLARGHRLRLPARPRTVAVVWGDGQVCQREHAAGSYALAYVRDCDAGARPRQVWIVQPDGVVQRRGVAPWNEQAQDPPAPGAWIVVDDPRTPWAVPVLEQLARLLATQGPAGGAPRSVAVDAHGPQAAAGQDRQRADMEVPVPSPPAPLPAGEGGGGNRPLPAGEGGGGNRSLPAGKGGGVSRSGDVDVDGQGVGVSGMGRIPPARPRDLPLSASDWGVTGLLQTPTARMAPAGAAAVGMSRTRPYTHLNVNLQPLDWLEVSFRYTDVSNRLYGPAIAGDQSYKDKSIDFKLRLTREMQYLPELAVGVRDVGGTGLFAGEYVVASKRTGDLDWSLGLGWGYLGARGNLGNPLSLFGSAFDRRPKIDFGSGGEFNPNIWFRGRTSLFGGVQYHTPWDGLILKLEYDGNDYRNEPQDNDQKQDWPVNLGLVYRYSPNIDLSLGWERGNTLSLGVNFHGRLDRLAMPKLSDPVQVPVRPDAPVVEPDWEAVARALEAQTGWRVLELRRAGSELVVRFERAEAVYWQAHLDRIAAVLHRDVPGRVLVFRIQSVDDGLGLNEYLIDRQTWVEARTRYLPHARRVEAISERSHVGGFLHPAESLLVSRPRTPLNGTLGLAYQQSLGGPDAFVLYQLAASGTGVWRPRPDTWLTAEAQLRLLDNYDRYKYTAPSKLPRVRTNVPEYLTRSELTLPLLQLTHVGRLGRDQYYSVYGGLLESMYAGIGGEWLYRPWGSRVALGLDVNAVRQRGFEQDFSLRDYHTTTGHVSLYWDTGIQDVLATVRAGRYLAGDVGVTLDLSRRFANGVRIGAYATKTDVSAEEFGEGSFDKGIYVDIPLDAFLTRSSGSVAHILWQPLLRDGGAQLKRAFPLIDLTRSLAGDTLAFGPPAAQRRGPFGDVPAGTVDTARRASAFDTLGEDLDLLGHTLTGPGFWRSLLWMGGVSALAAALDEPADRLAREHGDSRPMRALEEAGNLLPLAALGFSGVALLASDSPTLARASFASLEAGAVGLVSALGLKYAIGRARPTANQGMAHFTPLARSNGDRSFPSVHATVAWAALTPYAKAYDAPWLYGLAALTNLARVGERKHWFSDTVAGALLGYGLGSLFWDSRRQDRNTPTLHLAPGEVGLEWKLP
jgi:membrane-associated phospholipid phosphatase